MARRRGKRTLGRLVLVVVIGGVTYYGYKRGWFDGLVEWVKAAGSGGGVTPQTITPAGGGGGGVDVSGGSIQLPSLDLSGFDLSGVVDWFSGLFKRNEPAAPGAVAAVPAIVSRILPAGGSVAGGATAGGAAAGAASGASTTSSAAAAAGGSLWSQSVLGQQLSQLAAAPVKTQLTAAALASVPIIVGTSPAVAKAVHQTNVAVSKAIAPLQSPNSGSTALDTYTVKAADGTEHRVIVSSMTGKVYDLAGNVLDVPADSVKKSGSKTTQVAYLGGYAGYNYKDAKK